MALGLNDFKPIRISDVNRSRRPRFSPICVNKNDESLLKEFIRSMKPKTQEDKEFTFLMIFAVVILILGLIAEYFK